MTDAQVAPAAAHPEKVGKRKRDQAPSNRLHSLSFWEAFTAPGKVTYDDKNVRLVVAEGWGMQELIVHIRGEIEERSFERLDRKRLQAEMKPYFEAGIDITPDMKESPRLPQLPWPAAARNAIVAFLTLGFAAALAPVILFTLLAPNLAWLAGIVAGIAIGGVMAFIFLSRLMARFKSDKIWPGLMEERLGAAIQTKFPNNDTDVRAVIDAYNHVFLDSNWTLIRLKRFFQTISIFCFYLAAAPVLFFMYVGNALAAAIAAGVAFVVACLVVYCFELVNSHIYQDKYLQSLRVSAQHVSNLIRDRMNSISVLFRQTMISITQDSVRGEAPKADLSVSQVEDEGLKDYNGFFAIQTLMWLAKRLEYIELHLHNRIHALLTTEAILSIAGYVMYLSLLVMGIAPAVCLLVHAGVTLQAAAQQGATLAWGFPAVEAAVALGIILFTLWVSNRSYFNDAWNPMKTQSSGTESVLDQHFDPRDLGGWQTFAKQELDVKLAARFQRAMFFINEYYGKLGQRIS